MTDLSLGAFHDAHAGSQLHVVLGTDPDLTDLTARLRSGGYQSVIQMDSDDGLTALNARLKQELAAAGHPFDAIHLYGHAAASQLKIGRDVITAQSLDSHAAGLAALGSALSPDGDVLLYGCDLAKGAGGRQFLSRLAAATGADLAASDDLTGSPRAKGDVSADWTLEVRSGSVQAAALDGDALGWTGRLGALQEPVRLQSINGVLDVTLRAHRGAQMLEIGDPKNPLKPGTLKEVEGFMTYAWTLNQGVSSTKKLQGDNEQGPTLQVNPGEILRIRLVNDLGDQPTNLHTHGLVMKPSGNADNVLLSIPAGSTNIYEYRIPKDQEPGVNWYHPHRHLFAQDQVYRGLAGFLVIGNGDNDIDQIKSMPLRMMMIQAQTIGTNPATGKPQLLPLGRVDSSNPSQPGAHFQVTVNGQYMPDVKFKSPYEAWVQLQINPRDLVRTFIPKAAKAAAPVKTWNFADRSNYKSYYVAQDGEAFPTSVGKTRVSLEPGGSDEQALELLRERRGGFATALAPGKRVTEVVTAPPARGQTYFAATTIQPGFPASAGMQYVQPLVRLSGYKNGGNDQAWDNKTLTSKSMQYEDLSLQPVDVVRDIIFETRKKQDGSLEFLINGRPYPDTPVLQPRAGQVEEWRVYNKDTPSINPDVAGPIPHPMHIHMQSFQAEAVNIGRDGYTIPPHYYDSDVWYMDPGVTSVFRVKWTPTLGESVYHCHNLFHEDRGMMAALNVIPAQPLLAVSEAGGSGRLAFYPLAGGVSQDLLADPYQSVYPFDTFKGSDPVPYTGGIRTAMGDVNSDGVPDAIVAQQRGGRVVVLDGKKKFYIDNLFGFTPFGANPGFGLNVASADVNGDTYADIIVAGGAGADGRVKVYSGATGKLLADFMAITDRNYRGGVSLATGNVDGSGRERILTAPAQGAAPKVSIWGWDLFTSNSAAQPATSLVSPSLTAASVSLKGRLARPVAGKAASTGLPGSSAAARLSLRSPLGASRSTGVSRAVGRTLSPFPFPGSRASRGIALLPDAKASMAPKSLGQPVLEGAVMVGDPNDRRGLTIATTYYGAANGGYRRLLTAPASNADRATLWSVTFAEGGSSAGAHAGHGATGSGATHPQLTRLTEFIPAGGGVSAKGLSLASVSTPLGSVVAITPMDGRGAITTFVPKNSLGYEPVASVFRPRINATDAIAAGTVAGS